MNATRLLSAIAVAVAVAPVAIAPVATAAEHVSVDKKGVILNGYDAVAYFTQNKAVRGSREFTAEHDGATYLFSSAENRNRFKADPEKYTPMYGGFCAYGAALGKKFDVNGKEFKIVGGKLYVNKNRSVSKLWEKDVPGYIEKADEAWPRIKEIPAKQL